MRQVGRFLPSVLCLAYAAYALFSSRTTTAAILVGAAVVATALTAVSIRYPEKGMLVYAWTLTGLLLLGTTAALFVGMTEDIGGLVGMAVLGGAATIGLGLLTAAMQRRLRSTRTI